MNIAMPNSKVTNFIIPTYKHTYSTSFYTLGDGGSQLDPTHARPFFSSPFQSHIPLLSPRNPQTILQSPIVDLIFGAVAHQQHAAVQVQWALSVKNTSIVEHELLGGY